MIGRIRYASIVLVILISSATMLLSDVKAQPGCPDQCSIAILSPAGGLNPGDVVGTSFTVSFAVINFSLVQPGEAGQSNDATEGHVHVWVNGTYRTIWATIEGIPFTLSPSTYNITLQMVNNDHTAFNPNKRAVAIVRVTGAPPGTPALNILSPAGALNNKTRVEKQLSRSVYHGKLSLGAASWTAPCPEHRTHPRLFGQ